MKDNKKKIYIVICFWGEYDDYSEVIEKSFYKKEDAEKYIEDHKNKNVEYKIDESEIE